MANEKFDVKEIGGYELIAKIGAGGMGAVFKARQKSLDRIVALKILPPSIAKDQKFIERFLREARTSAKLNHPNIVQGIDVGQDAKSGLYYFAMEIVDGPSLKGVLERERVFPEKRALEITRQVSAALECAERVSIVHRDIKPDNILLAANGAVKLADLGLARQTGANDAGITLGGSTLGTPFYMSPEQVRGELDKVDVRSDIYSLGATLFHLVTGRQPFTGATSALIMSKHLTEAVPKPRDINPEISEACSKLILKMLQKDAAKRQQSAADLSAEIDLILQGEPVPDQPPAPRARTGKHEPVATRGTTGRHRPVGASSTSLAPARQQKGNPALIAIGAVVVIGLIGAIALSSGNGEKTARPAARATAIPSADTSARPVSELPKAAETPPAVSTARIAQAADALDKALKANNAEGQDVFDKVMRLAGIEASVRATPSEAAWSKALADTTQAAEKFLADQTDYPALLALKNKCTQPPLIGSFERACKDAENKALAAWFPVQQQSDTKLQACDYAGARDMAKSFSTSPVPAVADAAQRELDRINALEKKKNDEAQKLAAQSKTQDERLRYEFYAALLKSTETLDLSGAQKTLAVWRAKPDTQGFAAEMAAAGNEFKWLEEQGAKACQEMAAKTATVDVILGSSFEKKKVIKAEPTGIAVSLGEGMDMTVPVGKIAVAEIVTYCGWNSPGKDSAVNAARYLFWRNALKDARKRIESPSNDDEKRVLERIDLVLNGKDKFYKPDAPKISSAAVPKEMVIKGKAPEGAKDVPVDLTWEAVSNTRKYRIERKVGAGDFQALAETLERKFRDEKQPLDTEIAYRIVALNTAGESAPSLPAEVKTPLPKIVNLLPAGDFETGQVNDWGPQDNTAKGALSFTTDGPHSGNKALLIKGFAGTDRSVAVQDGKKYEVTGWIKLVPHGENAGGGDCFCFVKTMDYETLGETPNLSLNANGGGGRERKKIAPNEWTKFQYTFTAKGDHIRFRLHKHRDDNVDALFDDIVVSEAP